MKASVIAYGGILLILIISSLITIYIVGGAEPVNRNVVSVEGKLLSFVNEADLLAKTFSQSIEFISQRAAYDLGLNGGTNNPYIFWNYFYPRIDVLESELEKSIENNLPSSSIKNRLEVTWGESEIKVSNYDNVPCGPDINSKCFLVSGEKNFSVYDKSIDTRIDFKPFKISSFVTSSYFKLLTVGRKIFEDIKYNSTLNDIGNLKNLLKADFPNLDFDITASSDTAEITITDNTCLLYDEYYCLAPLNPGENGIIVTGKQILYDYLKLKFKFIATQTSFTPPKFDFEMSVNPDAGSVKSGGKFDTKLFVVDSGTLKKSVHLSYSITAATTGNPDTIKVDFEKNDIEPSFNSIVTITTQTSTISDTYTIKITGTGDGVTKETEFTLTVNPTMDFNLDLNPDTATILQGEFKTTNIDLTFVSGTPVPVDLDFSGEPPNSQVTLTKNTCTPTCQSIMNVSTNYPTTPPGIYDIEVVAIGGGQKKTAIFRLEIKPFIDFKISLSPIDRDTILQGGTTSTTVTVENLTTTTGTVDLTTLISTTGGLTDPLNFGISVSYDQPSGNPTFSTNMKITTDPATPFNDYSIVVIGTYYGIIRTKTFTLTVKKPACFQDSDCDDSNPCTGVLSEGKIDKCRNAGLVDAYCERPPLPVGTIPNGGACGTGSGTCPDKCESDHEYRLGNPKTCSKTCDGSGNPPPGGCQPCTPDYSSCTPSDYNTIKDCYYECKDNLSCREAYLCSEESCQTCNSWCALNSCDTSWGCGSCTVSGQVRRGNESDPFCTYYWPACGGYLCSLCVCTQETCTASCSYDETCTYGKFCPKQTFTITDCDYDPAGGCVLGTNTCTISAQCAYPGSEPTCTMNTDFKCDWVGYVYYNCRWEPPAQTFTATCS